MADYLVQEDGASRILQEDGSSSLLLETTGFAVPFIASATVVRAPTIEGDPSTYSTAGTFTFVVPDDVHSVYVKVWGGGGGGGANFNPDASGGGGGGAYAANPSVPVTPGSSYTVTVGASGAGGVGGGSTDGAAGGDSTFTGDSSTTVTAKGGGGGSHSLTGGTGGQASSSVGTTKFSGGNGANGVTGGNGGGGGAAASPAGNGANGSGATAGAGANGGGSGGNGGVVSVGTQAGFNGATPGGGGGGDAQSTSVQSGNGGVGTVVISWSVIHVPAIASATTVYPPALFPTVTSPPFIASTTVVYTPTLIGPVVVPFIGSVTVVYPILSLFTPGTTGVGPGNGGELFQVALAANGATETATLDASITSSATSLTLTGDSGMPLTPFCVTIDSEILYITTFGPGQYRVRGRGVGNTTAASHTVGASVTWDDSYDMAITSSVQIHTSFTVNITGSGSQTYPGWLICFDSTQGYLGGSRYPMHVTEVVGVFDAGAGTTGTNRCDAAQPNAICVPATTSDDCPAALSNPARISTNIAIGDVAVIRYTNPEASTLILGSRSAALQSWFGMKRVDDTDNDVTFTDTTGHVVDTDPGVGDYTGSVDGEWTPPVLGPGIGPSTGLPTSHDVPYTSVTLPGSDRFFTDGIHYSEKGWPIACLAVRQGTRRIPNWGSWDWKDFNYSYSGFGTDATFCQLLVNRNGMVYGSVPEVDLPGPQDIDGPDAVWDDGSYYFATAWYVVIWAGSYLTIGPSVGGGVPTPIVADSNPVPTVDFTGGTTTVSTPVTSGPPPAEGGSGGGIPAPAAAGLNFWARF